MLYEVITINGVMGYMMTEDAGGVAYIGGQCLAAGSAGEGRVDIVLAGRESEDGEDTLSSLDRITSYNVCYTKLLRLLQCA